MRKHNIFSYLLAFLLTHVYLFGQNLSPVHFRFGLESFPSNFEMVRQKSPEITEIANGRYVRYIQSAKLLSTVERTALAEAGVHILEYIPFGVYLVSIPAQYDLAQLQHLQVRSILPVQASWKLARNLRERPLGDWAVFGERVAVNVQLYAHVSLEMAVDWCKKNGLEVLKTGKTAHFIQLLVPQDNLENIAALPIVQYMELLPPPAVPEDTRGRSLHRSNMLDSDAPSGKKYNGAGVGVLVRDDGQLGPHIDFQGRLTNLSTRAPGDGTHGDGVAGILTGAGNLDPTKKGMAAGATLYAVDYTGDFQDETIDLFLDDNVTITNSSYSNGCNSGYTLTSFIVDEQMYTFPTLMHVFSAGNANGDDCAENNYGAGNQWGNITGGHKQGKNSIATANLLANATLDNSSSRGPAYDGRIKPDISAHGNGQASASFDNQYQVFGGTSAAAPGIAGCLAQLTQAYKTLYNGQEPSAALLKTLLLNSANDLGNAGPDFRFGWGHVNASRALRHLEASRWTQHSVDNSETITQNLEIPAGVRQAKVMLYWPEAPASELAARALINDLDLTLTAANGTVYLPWKLDPTPDPVVLNTPAGKGRDSLNNVEQVAIDNPPAGTYTITIQGTEVPLGPQSFFLAWEFLTDSVTLTYPNGGEGFVPGETERIHWDASGNTGNFVLRYSSDGGANWQTMTTVPGTVRMYDWPVPNAASGQVQIQIQRGSQSDINDAPFNIAPVPQNLEITRVCPDTMQISWTDIQDTLSYDVYLLGNKYMELVGSTPTNNISIPISDAHIEKWVSARSTTESGMASRRAIALRWPGGLKNCPQPDDLALNNGLPLENNSLITCSSLDYQITVMVDNAGINPINNAIINYQIDNQPIVSEPLPVLGANASVDYTFLTPLPLNGNQSANIRIWTSYPADDYRYNDTLSYVLTYITQPIDDYFTEDFEASSTLPNGWQIVNPDASEDGITWELISGDLIGANGAPTRSLFLDCFSYNDRGMEDYVYLRPLDLSNIPSPGLSFDVSHAAYNGTYNESLRVEVFPNCDPGATPVVVWQKSDPELATVPNNTEEFKPDEAEDWRTEYVDLQQFSGQSIFVRFASVNDYGNSLFLDNINLLAFNLEVPNAAFSISADSICRNDTLYFQAFPSGSGTINYAWSFGSGAFPTTATGFGPHAVRYLTAGNKTPRLIASNLFGVDTVVNQVYTKPFPVPNFTFQTDSLTVSFNNTTQNGSSYLWTFGDGNTSTETNPVHSYAAPGNYSVKLSATNECRTVDKINSIALTTGVSDLLENWTINILPNPTEGDFRVELNGPISGAVRLSLLDTQGRLVRTVDTVLQQAVTNIAFDNLSLAKGVYRMQVITEQSLRTLSIVVQ